jgi:cytochrome c peroxidase
LTPEKVNLGRQLFFGAMLSADHVVSCATCHNPNKAFADGRATARGVHGAVGARNTPSLVNAGFGQTFFWDGRAATLEAQVLGPIFNPKEMGLTEAALQRQTGLSSAEVADALANVVEFYSQGGRSNPDLDQRMRPIRFTPDEKHALVAFLKTLSSRVSEGF